ncbi:hypothetical protein NQ318_007022 [Aromia moschata]|uniref:Mos1 transposase HTH domain-containing protein n=1 Tax=Aromia moschata TaxID=1265417 RepID=A0AAV8Y3A8_9CUCU|nr:hypothetical protein NQ318_007022 [Aromia moschata]
MDQLMFQHQSKSAQCSQKEPVYRRRRRATKADEPGEWVLEIAAEKMSGIFQSFAKDYPRDYLYGVWLLNNRTDAATSALRKLMLGKTFIEVYAMLKEAYGNECLSRTQVFEWFKRFKEERETTEDDPPPGMPSTPTSKTDENFKKIGKLIREDRRAC